MDLSYPLIAVVTCHIIWTKLKKQNLGIQDKLIGKGNLKGALICIHSTPNKVKSYPKLPLEVLKIYL